MSYRAFVRGMLAASLLAAAPLSAMADNFGAAIVGGIIGSALMNGASQPKRSSPGVSSATRSRNAETQTALNYFGFAAGTPDGVLGSRSRSAIMQYQGYMGFPATGRLQPFERDHLVGSYNRAALGGPDVTRSLNKSRDGTRGLLVLWRDGGGASGGRGHGGMGYAGLPVEVSDAVDEIAESTEPSPEQLLQRAGFIQTADLNGDGQNDYIIDTSVTGSSFWCGASQCTTMLFVSSAQGYQRRQFQYLMNPQRSNSVQVSFFHCDHTGCRMNDPLAQPQRTIAPVPGASVPAAPPQQLAAAPALQPSTQPAPPATLPSFAPQPAPAPSLASYCEKVGLGTSSNGGFMTVATMSDPAIALGEQFCFARTYAKTEGEQMLQRVPGLTPAAVAGQCAGFKPLLAPYVSRLASVPARQVVADVAQYAATSGLAADQLKATAKICLYSGYRDDNMAVALGSALHMVGLGETPYAELVAHHLNKGFGAEKNPLAATGWYRLSIEALEGGAPSVFGTSLPDRTALLRAAALGTPPATDAPVATSLPTFTISD
ncbi:Putative peptidoglycan binding domain-containing protein [Pseudooceanicola antarcticus]|uniref:Peptidoglycan-binding protein n=1 Tax=Pseudooceanicola antarcticus TaxID=1247613 RepID=A0A285IUC2_9RHOB|nr:peptidoglycan-binding domain-containing protein [Pseudooceanicola antarcticus]PJE32105.1 peptidoglycan-binding protein [Pseudooceanicola antarcticus]SNY51574.1 Putative peptidoglycan binding domain-containing protein [Pseudooceanicola antarcticus]